MTTLENRIALQARPERRPAMYHSWRAITFLHWPVDPASLQRLLPPGLRVDTHDGNAFVGLVPFTMLGIRLNGAPTIPGLRASHETNVRTYVVDEHGIPGVWFFSLDAENPVFVQIARAWYHLPYIHSKMNVERTDQAARYESTRRFGAQEQCEVEIEIVGEPSIARPGTLEFFLVERYILFAHCRGRLLKGRVWHEPYRVQPVAKCSIQEGLVRSAQITVPNQDPLTFFSPGVDVEVFALQP